MRMPFKRQTATTATTDENGLETLNPALLLEGEIETEIGRAHALAVTFKPGEELQPFLRQIIGRVARMHVDYNKRATSTLQAIAGRFVVLKTQLDQPVETEAAKSRAELTKRIENHVRDRVRRKLKIASSLKGQREDERKLAIGIFGDPELSAQKPSRLKDVAAFLISLFVGAGLDLSLNLELMSFGSTFAVAISMSLLISLIGATLAHFASRSIRTWKCHRQALAAFSREFPDGKDFKTGKEVFVLPLPPGFAPMASVTHGGLILLAAALVWVRLDIMRDQPGANAIGLFATFLVIGTWFVQYLFEAFMSGIEHARLRELHEMQENLGGLEEEHLSLSEIDGTDEFMVKIGQEVSDYEEAAVTRAKALAETAEKLTRERNEFDRLLAEFQASHAWFTAAATDVAEVFLADVAGSKTAPSALKPNDLSTMIVGVLPEPVKAVADFDKIFAFDVPQDGASEEPVDVETIVLSFADAFEARERSRQEKEAERARVEEAQAFLAKTN